MEQTAEQPLQSRPNLPRYALPFDRSLIERIARDHPTPFYLYCEEGIRGRTRQLMEAFRWNAGFREYFAVKATPNPNIVAIFRDEGCGADCSSLAELVLCEKIGMRGRSLMFTSTNTTRAEFAKAHELGAIVNLDHPDLIDKLLDAGGPPDVVSFRYNPDLQQAGNAIIGNPRQSKFGCTREQVLQGYQRCKALGVARFGLHAMIVSNELRQQSFVETARILFDLAVEAWRRIGIKIEWINLGGGIGLPYRPEDGELDLAGIGDGVRGVYEEILGAAGLTPVSLFMENGRAMTGPFGYLVTRVINRKETYKKYVGVDACMANLMRPALYGAYHHITVLGKESAPLAESVDVVGSICENNDKFAVDRPLPAIALDDILVIHDAGAHGHAMGFQYNGRLRCAELLLGRDGEVRLIRRAETLDDYFATVTFPQRRAASGPATPHDAPRP
jgi:diaminopimelate decarboxylase